MSKTLREFISTVLQEKVIHTQDMKCPKCKTATHADDVGHANYYECPKCHYRWQLTEDKIRKSFGEPLVESIGHNQTDDHSDNTAVILHDASGLKLIVWDESLETKVYEGSFASQDFEAMLETMRNNNVGWVRDFGMEEPVSISTWLRMNASF